MNESNENKDAMDNIEEQNKSDGSDAGQTAQAPKSILNLDERLESAHRKGASAYVMAGAIISIVLLVFFAWLFIVKGYVFIVGPNEAVPSRELSMSQGLGFVSEDRVYIFGSNAVVDVSAERFETASVVINSQSPANIEVVLMPSPGVINSQLPADTIGETAWLVDSTLVASGINFTHTIAPGTYSVEVANQYYQPWQQQVTVDRAQDVQLAVSLIPVEGTISINSNPAGASISVDGKAMGVTPMSFNAAGGQYQVKLQYAGYEVLDDAVELVVDDANPSRNYNLEPLKGTLQLTTSPNDGLLVINGAKQTNRQVKLAANATHSLRYSKPGFYAISRQITLVPGETKSLSLALKKEMGEVRFASSQPAQLYIDGKLIGATPQTLNLQATVKKAEFKKEGYRTVVKSFTSKGNKSTLVNANMLTEFEARRAQGIPLFVSTLGIEMKRFQPTQFVMGSPPNEAGRLRNEHQVKVDFTRNIWVSKHEVTEAQFKAYDASKPSSSLPITQISWLDAAKYTNWLSEKEGLKPFYKIKNNRLIGFNYQNKGYRLPTEAEWEWLAKKAFRAKNTKFVWGNVERVPNKVGNFADASAPSSVPIKLPKYQDGFASKAPVGSFKADRAGLFDMAGNVSEWVNDFYTNTPPNTKDVMTNYMGATRGQQFVVKGAHYQSGKMKDLRASLRTIGEGPADTVGFRIARYD